MGYRQHNAVLDKSKVDTARNLPKAHFMLPDLKREDYPDISDEEFSSMEFDRDEACNDKTAFYQLTDNEYGCTDDYCIGTLNIPNDIGEPFYLTPETQELFEHYNPRILGPAEFEQIIDVMRLFIRDYYKGLLKKHITPEVWQKMIEDKVDTWEAPYIKPYNLDSKRKNMVNSFDAEYQIWDMIRVYRSMDWDNQVAVFFGW